MVSPLVKNLGTLVAIFVLAFIFLRFAPPLPISSVVTQKQDMFTVSGEGKVTVVPDTALVSLGINLTKPTVKEAQAEANKVMTGITQAVKDSGVGEKDIKTTSYSINPEFDYRTGPPNRVSAYRVFAEVNVKVRDLEKINDVIDRSTAAGANSVGGIQLTVDEDRQKELLQQAREEAVKEAKSKAESLAKAAGLTLGRIVNVQESSGGDTPPRPMMAFEKAADAGGGAANPTQIQPGSTDIFTTVTLSYETR